MKTLFESTDGRLTVQMTDTFEVVLLTDGKVTKTATSQREANELMRTVVEYEKRMKKKI